MINRLPRKNLALLLHHMRAPGDTLRESIYAAFVRLINSGELGTGDALPSTRDLAAQLKVARNTVNAVYRKLENDGIITASDRAVFRVSNIVVARSQTVRPRPSLDEERVVEIPRFPGSVTDLPRIVKDPQWKSCTYPFIYGQCDPSTFATANWRTTVRELNSVEGITVWTRESYDDDHPELIEALVRNVLPQQGILASPDQILITSGAQNALFLIAKLLIGPGDLVVVEDPGYTDVQSIFKLCGAAVQPVSVDQDGLLVHEVSSKASIIYCTPERQFPTSVRLSNSRRDALIARVEKGGVYLVEDGYDSELPFDGEMGSSLRAVAQSPNIIHVGSFSKTIAPGLRIGYVVASRAIINELRQLRRLILRNPSTYNQAAIGRFIRNGYYDTHLQRLRAIYLRRYNALITAIEHRQGDLLYRPIAGGASLWVRLPTGIKASLLYPRLLKRSVFVENGDLFYAKQPKNSYLRLGFSSIEELSIPEGIARLADEITKLRR